MALEHLKALLVAKGKTQSELAAALGRDKSAITNLLQGKRQLKAAEIPVIARFLGVSETDVLGTSSGSMAEPSAIPFQGTPSAGALASGRIAERGGQYVLQAADAAEQCYALEVTDEALNLAGLVIGDVVICNPAATPKPGDIVVAQVYHQDGSAKTVLRRFQPPFLDAHSSRQDFDRLHEERANVAVLAPVVRALRFYT